MEIRACSICGLFYYYDKRMDELMSEHGESLHVCPPRWHVYWDGVHSDLSEYVEIIANSAEEAAEKFLEEENKGAGGDFVEKASVLVRRSDNEEWVKFTVEVEYEPSYSAYKE